MIVFPTISQKKFIIGNDTLVGYTKKENRTLAVILQEREMYYTLHSQDTSIISKQDNVIVLKDSQLRDYNKQTIKYELICDTLLQKTTKLSKENISLYNQKRNVTVVASVATISTILLLLIIIL